MDLARFPAYLLKGVCPLSSGLHHKVKFSLISLIASNISHEHLVEVCGEALQVGCRFCLYLWFLGILCSHGSPLAAFSKFCLTFCCLLLWYLLSTIHALHKWQCSSLISSYKLLYFLISETTRLPCCFDLFKEVIIFKLDFVDYYFVVQVGITYKLSISYSEMEPNNVFGLKVPCMQSLVCVYFFKPVVIFFYSKWEASHYIRSCERMKGG